ncbi:hypothetical protein BDR22DRAFT_884339 [Usnea florida]
MDDGHLSAYDMLTSRRVRLLGFGTGRAEGQIASVVVSAPVNKKLIEDLTQLDVTSVSFTRISVTMQITPNATHHERLVLFLTNTPPNDEESERQRIEIALAAYNTAHGTAFTVIDHQKTLSSSDLPAKKRLATILQGEENAAAGQALEKELADIKAQVQALRERQARERAR